MRSKRLPNAATGAAMLVLTGADAMIPRKKRIALPTVADLFSLPAHAIDPTTKSRQTLRFERGGAQDDVRLGSLGRRASR